MLSLARSYTSKVANRLTLIKSFAEKHNIHNRFLDTVYIGTNHLDVATISFRGGINLNPEDNQDITLGFRKLNQFEITKDGVTWNPDAPPLYASEIQKDLLNYAVLVYGLQYSGSSYAQFITPSLVKVVDNWLEERLDNHDAEKDRIFGHFRLSYALQNASRLNYVA